MLADLGTWDAAGVVARVIDLVQRARASGTPVVWVQHTSDELVEGEAAWQYAFGLVPAEGEPVVHKQYDVTLVSDCRTTGEFPAEFTGGEQISAQTKINFTNAYVNWGMDYPDTTGSTITAAELTF